LGADSPPILEFGVGRSAFGVFFFFISESEGCLVALAVFKTVVGSQEPGQVRFLSSPQF
jgi:hypothetical protein